MGVHVAVGCGVITTSGNMKVLCDDVVTVVSMTFVTGCLPVVLCGGNDGPNMASCAVYGYQPTVYWYMNIYNGSARAYNAPGANDVAL